MRNLMMIGGLFVLTNYGIAQQSPENVFNWPEDRATAEEKNVLYTDNLRSKLYTEAVEPLEYLISVAPNLNPAIYINGAKIYEALAASEADPAQQLKYQERAMDMYDMRIKYFNNEATVLNRQAFTAYKFYKSNAQKYGELKALFDRAFKLNGESIYDSNLIAYMDVLRRYRLSGGSVPDAEVLDIYATITSLIQTKLNAGGNAERLHAIADNVDKMLAATVAVDCSFVAQNLGPKLEQNPRDLKLAKKIFQLILTGKCTDIPLALRAAELLYSSEPAFGLAKFIASRSQLNGNFSKSLRFYKESLKLADSPHKRGEIYFDMAKLYAANNQKAESRSYAFKALKQNYALKDAYALIGDLYMNSYETCHEGISRIQDRAVFIAAFEMYGKAGDYDGMANARAQFPSMEDIFNEGKEIGDSVSIGCWINEKVQLERRPAN